MGKTKFRILSGLILFANLVAMSEIGALFGFLAIWALIIAAAPLFFVGGLLSLQWGGASMPQWTPLAVLGAIGLMIAFVALRRLFKAFTARRTGRHDEARSLALSAFMLASVPSSFFFSVQALERAWP